MGQVDIFDDPASTPSHQSSLTIPLKVTVDYDRGCENYQLEVSAKNSVDQVKRAILTHTHLVQSGLGEEYTLLLVETGKYLETLFTKFVTCDPLVAKAVETRERVHIHVCVWNGSGYGYPNKSQRAPPKNRPSNSNSNSKNNGNSTLPSKYKKQSLPRTKSMAFFLQTETHAKHKSYSKSSSGYSLSALIDQFPTSLEPNHFESDSLFDPETPHKRHSKTDLSSQTTSKSEEIEQQQYHHHQINDIAKQSGTYRHQQTEVLQIEVYKSTEISHALDNLLSRKSHEFLELTQVTEIETTSSSTTTTTTITTQQEIVQNKESNGGDEGIENHDIKEMDVDIINSVSKFIKTETNESSATPTSTPTGSTLRPPKKNSMLRRRCTTPVQPILVQKKPEKIESPSSAVLTEEKQRRMSMRERRLSGVREKRSSSRVLFPSNLHIHSITIANNNNDKTNNDKTNNENNVIVESNQTPTLEPRAASWQHASSTGYNEQKVETITDSETITPKLPSYVRGCLRKVAQFYVNKKVQEFNHTNNSNNNTQSQSQPQQSTLNIPSNNGKSLLAPLDPRYTRTYQVLFILPNTSTVLRSIHGSEKLEKIKEKLLGSEIHSKYVFVLPPPLTPPFQESYSGYSNNYEKFKQSLVSTPLTTIQKQTNTNDVTSNDETTRDNGNNTNANNTPSSSHFIVLDHTKSLDSFDFIQEARFFSHIPRLMIKERTDVYSLPENLGKEDLLLIKYLVPPIDSFKGEEVTHFRKNMAKLRESISHLIPSKIHSNLHLRISTLPIPTQSGNINNILNSYATPLTRSESLPALSSSPNASQISTHSSRIFVQLHLPPTGGETVIKTVLLGEGETATQFIERMYDKHLAKRGSATQSISSSENNNDIINSPTTVLPTKLPTDYILKVVGFVEYIYGNYDLRSFEYIRKCITQNSKIELALVERPKDETICTDSTKNYYNNVKNTNIDLVQSATIEDELTQFDYCDSSSVDRPWDNMTCISIRELNKPFRVNIVGIEGVLNLTSLTRALANWGKDVEDNIYLYFIVEMYHGGILLTKEVHTQQLVSLTSSFVWNEWLSMKIEMSNIPQAARLSFTLFLSQRGDSSKDVPLGWVNHQVCNFKGQLETGMILLRLWPDAIANPIGPCVNNPASDAIELLIQLDDFILPVVFPLQKEVNSSEDEKPPPLTTVMKDFFERIQAYDPLYSVTEDDQRLLWQYRSYAVSKPEVLPRLLLSVNYNNHEAVSEVHRLLRRWPKIPGTAALELLDAKYADATVREYAVNCLEDLPEEELIDYLLQLVQVLKYEPHHDNSLARYLLKRSLISRIVGHSFFWYLRAELHVSSAMERYGLLLEAYLRGCGSYRIDLAAQHRVINKLIKAANIIKPMKDSERREAMCQQLESIKFPPRLKLTLNPRIEINELVVEKCKYMDSKKLPLWLVLTNADPAGAPAYVIFKSGDDLRQDMLTLQMIRLMDKLWQKEGLDLRMSPYQCVSTGDNVGMIEVVLNSDTTANIQKAAGGVTAAFRADPLANWLRENNPAAEQYAKAVETFILSCAGYCVATYVLGIGDRHNDNVMCTKTGRLFHIDFGHFLGNYKKKFGIKRERAPFVFTPEFAHVMKGKDSPQFLQFVELCCHAYNILRKHAAMFINLFQMMLSTGIPELNSVADLAYLRDAFALDKNDQQAAQKFTDLIYESLNTKTTQINNAIHILAH